MEERIPQPREEAQAPTVSEPAPTTGKPCDGGGDALLPPVVKRRSSSSGEESSPSSSDDDEEEEQREFDFEFPFVSRDSPAGTAAPADELFADGRIRAFYPVFGRGAGCVVTSTSSCTALPAAPPPRVRGQLGQLFLEETRERNSSTSSTSSTSSSSSSLGAATDDNGGLEGAAPESYCVWRPAGPSATSSSASSPRPQTPRKSGSTGSMARPRWRRISDLVVGRSHSDGREKFLFLAAATPAHHDAPRRHYKKPGGGTATAPAPAAGAYRKPPPPPPPPVAAPATEADAAAAAHRIAYLARGGVPPGGTPRRTFLPYREELVGFFANVNGISRSHHHHPF